MKPSAYSPTTSAVLELGGKSPCIVDDTAKLKLAAKRIVFGKFINCGQTCVAPDFILCQKSVKDEFISGLKAVDLIGIPIRLLPPSWTMYPGRMR